MGGVRKPFSNRRIFTKQSDGWCPSKGTKVYNRASGTVSKIRIVLGRCGVVSRGGAPAR